MKRLIDFNQDNPNIIKSLAIKKNTNVKMTSRFMNGNIVIFAKISLTIFIDDGIDVFGYPDGATRDVYLQKKILKSLPYLLLTGTDGAASQFVFASELNCAISEGSAMQIILLRYFLGLRLGIEWI